GVGTNALRQAPQLEVHLRRRVVGERPQDRLQLRLGREGPNQPPDENQAQEPAREGGEDPQEEVGTAVAYHSLDGRDLVRGPSAGWNLSAPDRLRSGALDPRGTGLRKGNRTDEPERNLRAPAGPQKKRAHAKAGKRDEREPRVGAPLAQDGGAPRFHERQGEVGGPASP